MRYARPSMHRDLMHFLQGSEVEFSQFIQSLKPETYTGRYAMHRYWARKPPNIVAEFVKHYSKVGEIVLDPFCGSGVTAIESLILRRKAICVDLDPMAVFITRMTALDVDLDAFERAFSYIRAKVVSSITPLYETVCPSCKNQASMLSLIWKDERPTIMRYACSKCGRRRREVTQEDLQLIEMTERAAVPGWYPSNVLLKNSRINAYKGMSISDLFTKRNLIALSIINDAIDTLSPGSVKEMMRFAFTAALSQASKMVFVVRRRGRQSGKIRRSEEVGSRVIGYWIPKEHFEINAWNCFENRYKRITEGKQESSRLIGTYCKEAATFEDLTNSASLWVLNQSATDLSKIQNEAVDYVFTDPPFGDQVPYLELDALWSSWMRFKPDYEQEIVISDSREREKSFEDYARRLRTAFKEIHRVLKADRYLSVAFYNYDLRVWHALISSCVQVGFQKVSVLPIRNSHPSIVQLYRHGGSKGALVVTFRKSDQPVALEPPPADTDRLLLATVRQTIQQSGGSATTSEVYDAIIATLIQHNALDSEKDVQRLLKSNCAFEDGRWFMKNRTIASRKSHR